MPTFTYKGIDHEGRPVRGACVFASRPQAEAWLNKKNLSGRAIYNSATKYSSKAYSRVSAQELALFCREMSVMFVSQISILQGVLMLAEQTGNAQLKTALAEIHERMSGDDLTFAAAAGMYPHIFTGYLADMLQIGEASGTLNTVFAQMADYFEKEYRLRKKLKAAVMYPLALTILMAAIVVLMIIKILPMFESTLLSMGGEMPAATKAVFNAADYLVKYFWIIAAAVVAVVAFFALYPRTRKGRLWLDKLKITFPVSGYIQSRILTGRVARSLSLLLKSGVQLLIALEKIRTLPGNAYIEDKFAVAIGKVRDGAKLSEILKDFGVFPPLFISLAAIGEATGRLDEMLSRAAGVFDDEADEAMERLTVTIEPALIIVLAVIVGVILLSVMLPMISIMNAIQ